MKNVNVKGIILRQLKNKKEIRSADIVKATGFSRAYVNRFLNELEDAGEIVLLGKTNQAKYVLAKGVKARKLKEQITSVHKILRNTGLEEDRVLDEIKSKTGIFLRLPGNISDIVDYAFSEMLNNAIEHSRSEKIEIFIKIDERNISFVVADRGIGVFHNIMRKRRLKNEMEAIQDLLKGKQTTAPEKHTGEGIFFTSKVADILEIKSFQKKLIFNNFLDDIFIKDIRSVSGTRIFFQIDLDSARRLDDIFREFAGSAFEFSKTEVAVNLYKMGDQYISRSQARRILAGLEKFKNVILDFKKVETVGQGFADEIFRVWQHRHPHISISYQNADENIIFMIRRALAKR